ncbi:unnamed protein product [Microthlaspi erraticum]|uniref:F-box associated beta-propeller type 3 domain-containing protein n=1 Tax=Microthlaspi erraticum TaxID=1685480 RepID=A0A6D2HH19_9BRAS|nr:unnamed protein product [Microthlaspi erraticum]
MVECGIPRHYPNSDGICINGGVYYSAWVNNSARAIVCFDVRRRDASMVEACICIATTSVGEWWLYIVGVAGGTDEVVLWSESVNPLYVYYYNMERNTFRRVEIKGMDAVRDYTEYMTLDYVEDVKLMEHV